MRAGRCAHVTLAALLGACLLSVPVAAEKAEGEEAFYPGCIDRVYSRQREAALFELYNNVEKLQAAPTVLRRFQQGTRLALHIDERNLMAQNITDIHELPTTDIIALFDLPVESDVEEGWCTRILDIYGSLFFRRVVDTKFASKVWLDIEGDLPVSAKMAERIYQSPSSVAWPEGDANMDRFYAARKKTLDMLVKDREVRSEANAQAMHGKELMWEEMSAEFRGVMGDDEPKPMVAPGAGEKKKKKKKKSKNPPPVPAEGEEAAASKFISLDDNAPEAQKQAEGAAAAGGEAAAAAGAEAAAAGEQQQKTEL